MTFMVGAEPLYLCLIGTQLVIKLERFANGYCSRVGEKVRGWAKLFTCFKGKVWLITWRSFANQIKSNRACHQ